MKISTEEKKKLSGLYFAAFRQGSKAAAAALKKGINAVRPAKPATARPAPSARTSRIVPKIEQAAKVVFGAATAPDPIKARDYADRARTKARSIACASSNATPGEMAFCRLVAQLSALRRPNESATLREWQAYASSVNALRPELEATGINF